MEIQTCPGKEWTIVMEAHGVHVRATLHPDVGFGEGVSIVECIQWCLHSPVRDLMPPLTVTGVVTRATLKDTVAHYAHTVKSHG